MIPRIKVERLNIEKNVEFIARYVNPRFNQMNKSRPFAEKTYQLFPQLIGKINDNMTDEEILWIVQPVVKQVLEETKEKIEERITYFQTKFDRMSFAFIGKLLKLYEVEWSENVPEIKCLVGYIPFYPRSVVDKLFFVSYADEERVLKGAAHEINHFIFFEKWKQLYGFEEGKEPMHPDPLWFVEEMIVDPTLNEPEIQELTGYHHEAYEQFYNQRINGKIVMEYVQEFYKNRINMKNFIDTVYKFSVKHIEELKEKCG